MTTHHQAILLVNLGSPDEPSAPAIARYLAEFLGDRRVVDLPKLVWWPILHGIILRTRPPKLVEKYKAVWQEEGAPLKAITAAQARHLSALLSEQNVRVYWAMRYQNPSVRDVLQRINADGVQHVRVIPMYPQYSMTTTATVEDALKAAILKDGHSFSYDVVHTYHEHPSYIHALKISILESWQNNGRPDFIAGDKLLLSFHGLPERNVLRGDPYQKQCQRTYELLVQALGLSTHEVKLSYQSRFGAQKWLQPYTQATLEGLAQAGTRRLDVICPGFAADCLETLEEVNIELREVFLHQGGLAYHYIPCLNTTPAHIQMLQSIALA
ncbi:ferrochelatase [Hydromonas duriensis]|uniref:Ferrochelatase n=1 Tax=Hydromonas duriensis TaxID=1527608 RepID=A0A4R6Y7Z7_9BURK|nr:ferrochelatase [Hydromonas duriensis]TDR31495.1 ferrochelatase [Hydromonas duriensis]